MKQIRKNYTPGGVSEHSLENSKTLGIEPKTKPKEDEEYKSKGKVSNAYTSPSSKGKTRVLRF